MKKLAKMAAERDAQLTKRTREPKWRDLYDCARCLFCDCALPINVSCALLRVFAVRTHKVGNCKTVLAKVLATA